MNEKKDLTRLLRYSLPHKKLMAIAFLFLIGATVGEMLGPIIMKHFIDEYLTKNTFPQDVMIGLFLLYLGVHVVKVCLTYLKGLYFQRLAFTIVQDIRVDVYRRVQELSMKYIDRTPIGAIVSRITNDTEAIKEFYVSVLATFLQNGVFLIGLFVTMFILDVKLAMICLFIVPVIYAIMYAYRQRSKVYYQNMRSLLSKLNAEINESVQGMRMIVFFRQQKRLIHQFEKTNEEHLEAGMKNIKLDSLLLRPATDLVYMLSIVMILSYFGWAPNNGVEIGVLFAFVTLLDRFFEPINEMMMKLSLYQQALVASSRVFEMMDEEEVAPQKVGEGHAEISKGEIQFDSVNFSYDGVRPVLKKVSFTAKEGETVAFVGHTGSGKSTIMNLLMRFYVPGEGQIRIDGHDLQSYDERELRKKIGLVLQDSFIFTGSIRDNIRLYDEEWTEADIKAATEFVQAHHFVESLDTGYETQMTERGSTLSSGQRQLLTFARTIVRNPKILVLDEATATVDTETEAAIQEALKKMREGRTTLVIAHRLSTIQDADCIHVLHNGEIVESGTHQQLLELQGRYYRMYLLQNKKTSVEVAN